MRVSVINLGCKVNRVESDSIALSYLTRGSVLSDVADADLIVVNTCTVTGEAEKKTRKAVRRALRDNSHAQMVITGCASAVDPDFFTALSDRIVVVDKADLLEECGDGLAAHVEGAERVGTAFPSRVSVKVQDGCNHDCSYCIVHVARGRAWSRPASEVCAEVCALARAGVREVVLSGIDLGSYADRSMGGRPVRLVSLVSHILSDLAKQGDPGVRLRIGSIEPRSVDEDFIELLASAEGRVCRHLHLPLQSGSDRVLSEMNRPYTAEAFLALVERLYDAVPRMSLTTDIIVGFPGEKDLDFNSTCEVARQARFSKIHVFRYSPRAGTPAAGRADQVEPAVKEARADELMSCGEALRHSFARSMADWTESIVVEKQGWGMSEAYYKVRLRDPVEPGTVLRASLTEYEGNGIFAL